VYGPYGNSLYSVGSMDTARGYTGQYADTLTGLDYYISRYYDPVAGIFLSPDAKEGNAAGMNPYAYVGGDPETDTDPSGQMYYDPGHGGNDSQQQQEQYAFHYVEQGGLGSSGLPVLLDMYLHDRTGWALAESYDENVMHGSTMVLLAMEAYDLLHSKQMNWNATPALMKLFTELNGMALPMLSQMEALSEHDPEMSTEAEEVSLSSVEDLTSGDTIDENGDISGPGDTSDTSGSDDVGCPMSFRSSTPVETKQGEQAIGTLKVGEQVLAYNPKTKQMEDEPILHVWINHDHDLVDLTITTKSHAPHSTVTTIARETIHTTEKHPFFTEEKGFLPVAQLKVGMHLLQADGRYGVVTGFRLVPGVAVMYNLEVAQDHTYTVGVGQWVVHNCGTRPGDVVPYKPSNSPFENHHGILNVWGKNNISEYDGDDAPTVALTPDQHNATRSAFASWRYERTGSVTGAINWSTVSPQDIQGLAEDMFDAAGVPGEVRQAYYNALNQYIYTGSFAPYYYRP
jgi:RHS repeat-associated protein